MIQETVVDEAFIAEMNKYRTPVQGTGLVEACSKNIVLFAERMLGVRLRAWQVKTLIEIQEAIEGKFYTKEFGIMTARQIGKTFGVDILCLWACTFNKYPSGNGKSIFNNTLVGVISARDKQARRLIRDVNKLILIGDKFMKDTYGDAYHKDFFTRLIDQRAPNNTETVTFVPYDAKKHGEFLLVGSKSGCMIESFPPTSAVLGYTFSIVIVDEAGKTDRISDTFFDEYAGPTGDALDAVKLYLSTPWETAGYFYRIMDPEGLQGTSHVERLIFTIDAIKLEEPEAYDKVMTKISLMRSRGYVDEVNRAYYCKFVTGEHSYFNPSAVTDLFTDEYQMLESYGSECDMGIDFGGQVKSRTVITITGLGTDGLIRRLYHRAYPVGQDLGLLSDVEALLHRFNVQRIIPDDCPAGDYLIRQMKDKGWNINPMNFRAEKIKKYGAFRAALGRDEIQSYEDDELKIEMFSLQFEHGKQMSVIHAAEGERDDLIDSFVMSCYFLVVDEGEFRFYDMDDIESEEEKQPFIPTTKKKLWWRDGKL